MDVKEQEILGPDIGTHWYYVSKGRALHSILRGTRVDEVLDVGAGSGVFSRQLIDAGICDRATCVDPAYSGESTESHNGHQLSFVRSVEDRPIDLVLMMDVLEHVEDDVQLLKHYTQSLSPNGQVAITVPAFQFLWSGHDVFLEHHRRYTRSMLSDVIEAAGLQEVRSRYFYGVLFPAVAAVRLAAARKLRSGKVKPESSLRVYGPTANKLLTLIHDVERRLLFPVNALAGLTIFSLARRKT